MYELYTIIEIYAHKKVEFHPERAELYTYDFIMACDNGQCNTFTITGTYM